MQPRASGADGPLCLACPSQFLSCHLTSQLAASPGSPGLVLGGPSSHVPRERQLRPFHLGTCVASGLTPAPAQPACGDSQGHDHGQHDKDAKNRLVFPAGAAIDWVLCDAVLGSCERFCLATREVLV